VQSCILTEVSDSGMMIFVTSSTFLKRKDLLKPKKVVSPDHQNPQPSTMIYIALTYQMYCVRIYGLHVYSTLVDLDSSGSLGVHPTPGLTSSTQVVCVCLRAYTSTHPPTTLTPAKIEKYARQNFYLYPYQNIA